MSKRSRTALSTLGVGSLFGLCVGSVSLGCASAPPPAPDAPIAKAPPPKAPPPDVTAVPTPSSLVFMMRVSKPAASMKVMTDWAHLPALDPAALIESGLDQAIGSKGNAALAKAVDANLPVDLVVAFDMSAGYDPMVAGSIPVKGLDDAKAALATRFEETAADDGVVHLKLKPPPGSTTQEKEPNLKRDPECELAPAAGAAPYRFICATNHDALTTLAGYLARTLPRQSFDADFHVELHAEPTKMLSAIGRASAPKMLTGLLGLNNTAEPATGELVTAMIGDFFDYVTDIDTMTMDATLDPAQGTLTMKTAYKSTTSLMAKLMVSPAEQADVVPSTFLRLPVDVDLVNFAGGADPADFQHAKDLAIAAAAEQLEKAKLGAGDARALTELIRGMTLGGKGLMAHGTGPAPDKADKNAKPGAAVDNASYWLFERDQPAEPTEKLAKAIVSALARPTLNKWWADHVTKTRKLPSAKVMPVPAGLPPGSLDVQITVYPEVAVQPAVAATPSTKPVRPPPVVTVTKPAVPEPPSVYHVLIAPDGPRNWVAFSKSEALAKNELIAVLATRPPSETLASRAGLESFKDQRMGSGGFFTVKGMLGFAEEAFKEDKHAPKLDWPRLLRALPAKGQTPIDYTSARGEPTAEDPGGVRDVRMTFPADAIRDAIRFGLAVAGPPSD